MAELAAECTHEAALRAATRLLRTTSATPAADARLLLSHAAGHGAAWFLSHGREPMDEAARVRFLAGVQRRAGGEPVAYVIGSAGFFGREFTVTPAVLVPRPETEHLVEAALDLLRGARMHSARIADIGTGSGAIAVTLAAEMPRAEVYATDISETALDVARANAERLGVAARVILVRGDLAAPLLPFAPFTCVVANLPYVRSADVPLAPHPVGHEPRVAVDGGADGLVLYRRLVAQLPPLLGPGASLLFEAAPDTIEPLAALVERGFTHAHVEIGEDYAGFERYVCATLP